MKLSGKMMYLTSKHLGPELKKPLGDVKSYAVLLCIIAPWHWDSTYQISVSEVIVIV